MIGSEALKVAATQIGVSEKPRGSNDGPEVRQYLASVKLGPGFPWCMAFIYWCTVQACRDLQQSNPLLMTGGVMRQWNERPALRVVRPQSGDVFVMDYGKGVGHTGFVEKVDGANIHTIEGNTNDEGSREGYEVCRRIRPIAKCKGFLRI